MSARWGVMSRWAACIAVALAGSGCAIQPNDHTLPGQTAVGDDGYSVTVRFDQVENLVPNSTVQQDNVVIGTVASIDTKDWAAVVELRLLRDAPVPKNAVFSIGQKTLLGAQYVDVVVPPKPSEVSLADGDVIPVEQTGTYPATEQVLGAVALLLNNGGLSQISTWTGELSTAFKDRVPDTKGLIRHANELLVQLDDNRAEIVKLLESLDSFSAGLRQDQDRVADALRRIAPGLRVLAEEREGLVDAVTALGRTSNHAVRVVRASETALLTNLDALGPILTNLGQVSESVPEALKMGLTIPWPAMTTRDAIKGDYFNQFTTLDLRGSVLANTWFRGLPPALQSGNPIGQPLSSTDDDPAEGILAGLDGLLGGLLPKSEVENAGPGSCLLSLLGLC